MKLTIEITKEQEWVLDRKFLLINEPYGNKISHIGYYNSFRCYLNDEELTNFINLRDELEELGLLKFILFDNGTSRYYELTKIGWMFFNELNK